MQYVLSISLKIPQHHCYMDKKSDFNKKKLLWPLLDFRAELDMRLTKTFKVHVQPILICVWSK